MLINAFLKADLNYCSRKLKNQINRLHERWLRIIYNNNQSTFDELVGRSCIEYPPAEQPHLIVPLSRLLDEYQKPNPQPHYQKGFLILQKTHF